MTERRGGLMTNLKRIIDEKGVQQRWLAEQVGVTVVSMSRYVSGERIPKAPLAIRMADVLGVDVKELYRWEPEERTEERTETHACDLISRQETVAALMETFKRNTTTAIRAKLTVEALPSAPQRTGRWIDHAEEGYVECPFCHSATNCDDNISDLHFCFSCGARMEGK